MSFDVREYARTAHGSLRGEVDLEAVRSATGADTARALAVFAALEGATMAHLRNVLVTSTHKDARVTAFLVSWAFEKFWIADALAAVAGRAVESGRPRGAGPVRRSVRGFIDGPDIVAAHLSLGLADSRLVARAYERIGDGEPAARELLERIRSIKSRHEEFFSEEADRRTSTSARARRLVARELARNPLPLGVGLLGVEDRRIVEEYASSARSVRT